METINDNIEVAEVKKPFDIQWAIDFVKGHKNPVDYRYMVGDSAQVIFFGESDHSSSSEKNELRDNLQQLKDLGITHLALERFDSNVQPFVDNFLKEKERGVARIRLGTKLALSNWEKTTLKEYLQLLDEAKRIGLGLLAIDKPFDKSLQDSGYSKSDAGIIERNEYWSDVLVDFFKKNPNTKVAIVCGAGHCGYTLPIQSCNRLLESRGIPTIVINFIGVTNVPFIDWFENILYEDSPMEKPQENMGNYQRLFGRASYDAGFSKEGFMLDLRSLQNERPADFFIHLPQIEAHPTMKLLLED
ncbi:MAG: ChaN family lipoprotein [bacterium]|nr:ChaN family lipoprotein [bacterium]